MAFLDSQGVSKLCALLKDKFDSLWTAVNGKQGALTAGSNITISNGVISAEGGSSYTAGDGIDIDSNNVISKKDSDLLIHSMLQMTTTNPMPGVVKLDGTSTWENFVNNIKAGKIVYISASTSYTFNDNYKLTPTLLNITTLYGMNLKGSSNSTTNASVSAYSSSGTQVYYSTYYYFDGAFLWSWEKPEELGDYIKVHYKNSNNVNLGYALKQITDDITTINTRAPAVSTSTDGTFKLTSIVSSGTPTYAWTADSSGGGSSEYYAGLSVPYAFLTNNTWDTDYRFAAAEFADPHSNNETVSLIKQGVLVRYQVSVVSDSSFVIQDHMEEIFGPASAIDPSTSVYTCRIGKSGSNYIPNYQPYNSNSNTVNQTISSGTWYFLRINRILFYWSKNTWDQNKGLAFIKDFLGINTGSSLPSTPSNDGTYLLKCVVSSGTPTYSWESVTVGGSY